MNQAASVDPAPLFSLSGTFCLSKERTEDLALCHCFVFWL